MQKNLITFLKKECYKLDLKKKLKRHIQILQEDLAKARSSKLKL